MLKMNEETRSKVEACLPHCCNWEEGFCLPLNMPCPQELSLTRVNCVWFREAVLPDFPELCQEVLEQNK